jgi:hypothetical protein
VELRRVFPLGGHGEVPGHQADHNRLSRGFVRDRVACVGLCGPRDAGPAPDHGAVASCVLPEQPEGAAVCDGHRGTARRRPAWRAAAAERGWHAFRWPRGPTQRLQGHAASGTRAAGSGVAERAAGSASASRVAEGETAQDQRRGIMEPSPSAATSSRVSCSRRTCERGHAGRVYGGHQARARGFGRCGCHCCARRSGHAAATDALAVQRGCRRRRRPQQGRRLFCTRRQASALGLVRRFIDWTVPRGVRGTLAVARPPRARGAIRAVG